VDPRPVEAGRSAAARGGTGPIRRPLRLTPRGVEATAALGAVLLAVLVSGYRIGVAHTARYPGHADPAFAYGVAQNISAGRGPTIDYVWHFLVPGTPLHHYAFDYWLPLPSYSMAAVLGRGHGLPAVLTLNVLLILGMAAGSYLLARSLTGVPWVPAVVAAAALVQPAVSAYAMQAESAIYLAAFALPAMAAASYARRRPWLWLVAGAFAGLAAMSRSEGMLLCLVLGVAALAWRACGRAVLRAGLLLAGYLVVSAPYLLTNFAHFGSPLPPAAASFPFITRYEDLFAPHLNHSVGALFGGFFEIRGHLIDLQLQAAFEAMSPIASVLVLLLIGSLALRRFLPAEPLGPAASLGSAAGLGSVDELGPADPVGAAAQPEPASAAVDRLRSALDSDWLVPVGFLLLVFGFDALLTPAVAAGGAVVKVMITGVPILLVLAVVQLGRLRLPAAVTALCCVLLIGYPLTSVAFNSRATIRHNNDIGRTAAGLAGPLRTEAGCLGRPVVLMTRESWEINQATGVATVALPTGSLAEILDVARQYGVTDIDNPAVRLDASTMAGALAPDGPLVRSPAFGARKVYRIRAATSNAVC
jgi:hypothetical protein